jgi:hypothetical protein
VKKEIDRDEKKMKKRFDGERKKERKTRCSSLP